MEALLEWVRDTGFLVTVIFGALWQGLAALARIGAWLKAKEARDE